ncbi:MAG: hypothetical protein LBE33_03410 [Zoogloeaceae bacterium]|jgi:hypothetical protein|nr:hypothetical protein [Zoogloeaceae bacterium]
MYEFICKTWTIEPERFNLNPIHQMPGLNNQAVERPVSARPYVRSDNGEYIVQDLLYFILVLVILIGVDGLARGLGKL